MDINKVPPGENPPDEINVLIEIAMRSDPLKYEFDKHSGFIFVDRMLSAAMHYPCNYGFIPNTKGRDGDPVDVLVISDLSIFPGAIIRCRPVGVLMMEDEAGGDEKIISVPMEKIAPHLAHIQEVTDIQDIEIQKIRHFFEHYKDLEPQKWVRTSGIEGSDSAKNMIQEGIDRYNVDSSRWK